MGESSNEHSQREAERLKREIKKMQINPSNGSDSDCDSDSDFVPVGFDYDGFNKMAAGILHLEKPENHLNKEENFLSYNALLARIEKHLKPSDHEIEDKVKIPISIRKEGTTKTSLNITQICNKICREVSHFKQFIEVELSVNCSIDGDGRLIIKGIFPEIQIQKIIRNYISKYVSCGVCGSLETTLEKEDKLLFKKCHECNASQSVNAIQQGYKALTTKRSVLRRKAAE